MTFKKMMDLEPGLRELERRMRAVFWYVKSCQEANTEDLILIDPSIEPNSGLPICSADIEQVFTKRLLYLVGPGGMHPLLKNPECYQIAHNALWRWLPRCTHDDECGSWRGEAVQVDFSDLVPSHRFR